LYRIVYSGWLPSYAGPAGAGLTQCAGGESPHQFEGGRRCDIFPRENAIRPRAASFTSDFHDSL